MSNVMTISKRTAAGLEEVLRTLLLDSENKVPAERLRIVGAISEGAVMESGSNANGYWVKFADGTALACNPIRNLINTTATSITNGIYRYTAMVTFPVAFSFISCIVANIAGGSGGYGWGTVRSYTVTEAYFHFYTTAAAQDSTTISGTYIVVGLW